MRRFLGVFTALVLVLALTPVAGAHHKPEHPDPPVGHQSTTTEGTSTTTTTSTTEPPSTTITTIGSTTTSTTLASSTTTSPTTSSTTILPGTTINLSQDWLITGSDTRSGFVVEANGHAIFIDGGSVNWSNFEVRRARTITFRNGAGASHLADCLIADSGGPNLGEYPLHWHLNGDSTRGTLVERCTVRNSVNQAFVPHGSHGITFRTIRAENIAGPALWWDPPGSNQTCRFQADCTFDNSNDIVVDGLVVVGVSVPPGSNGFRNTGAMLGAGSGNVIRNSSVVGVAGSVDCSAYHWPEFANQNAGGNVWVFENNTGTSACHGIFVWQNDSNHHIVDGFSGGGIDHGAYGNNYDYRNVNVPYLQIHAQGWVMSDSEVGEILVEPHVFAGSVTFTNVTGTGITVNDAPAGDANQPITLIFNGTNLTCGDVDWVNPHPLTRVVINSQEC